MDYVSDVQTNKKYVQNIVILFNGTYFSVRQPDAGLSVSSPYDKMVSGLTINASSADIKKANTSVAGCTFRLLDKNGIVSALIAGTAASVVRQDVTIWIGRSRKRSTSEANDFSEYYQLPITKIKKISHAGNEYIFSTSEDSDRMTKPIYGAISALSGDITSGTTVFTMRDAIDNFPAAGQLRVDSEIVSYTSKDNTAKTFSGVTRGLLGTTAAAHEANTNCKQTETITGNPLDIILKLLISGGGGGTYDVLKSGLGIDEALIDVAGIESIRDSLFPDAEIKLEFSNISSALKFIEIEILQFFNLRFTYSEANLTLAVLDKAVFVPILDTITEDSITSYPKWDVDDTTLVNRLKISWDYDEVTNQFLRYSDLTSDDSITTYGERPPLTFSFKGIKEDLNGDELVTEFARVLFARFSTPVPTVEVKTHIDKSLKNIGDKIYLESTKVPSPTGNLVFASDMEVVKQAINYQTGEVSSTFAFTSFTKIRSGFIAPSDMVLYAESQKLITIASGRAAKYRVGWYMRLFNEATQSFESDPPNKIVSFPAAESALLLDSGGGVLLDDGSGLEYDQTPGDFIEFENNWSTTLTTRHRIRFAKYNDVAETQKRYCFISDNGSNFDDGKPTYKVTY